VPTPSKACALPWLVWNEADEVCECESLAWLEQELAGTGHEGIETAKYCDCLLLYDRASLGHTFGIVHSTRPDELRPEDNMCIMKTRAVTQRAGGMETVRLPGMAQASEVVLL
jgi:hypothetical protein